MQSSPWYSRQILGHIPRLAAQSLCTDDNFTIIAWTLLTYWVHRKHFLLVPETNKMGDLLPTSRSRSVIWGMGHIRVSTDIPSLKPMGARTCYGYATDVLSAAIMALQACKSRWATQVCVNCALDTYVNWWKCECNVKTLLQPLFSENG